MIFDPENIIFDKIVGMRFRNPDEDIRRLERIYFIEPSEENRQQLSRARMRFGLLPIPRIFMFTQGWQAQSTLLDGAVISSSTVSHDGWWGIDHATWPENAKSPDLFRSLGEHLISSQERDGGGFWASSELPKPTKEQVISAHEQVVTAALKDGVPSLRSYQRWITEGPSQRKNPGGRLQIELLIYLKQSRPANYRKLVDDAAWISYRRNRKAVSMEKEPILQLPVNYFFENPRTVDPNTWLIHCSRNTFKKFRFGTQLRTLQLSTFLDKKVKTSKDNLEQPLDRAVFGFAFELKSPKVLENCSKYGMDAIIFKSNQAIVATHPLDDYERQVIFPLGSESDLIRVTNVSPDGISIRLSGKDYIFETVGQLIKALNNI